jgi:hypothetical protein
VDSQLTLNEEFRKLVEARIEHTLKGIEDTLRRILENQEISLKDLKEAIQSLEESFNLLSQKWNLQILYILFLRSTMGFSSLTTRGKNTVLLALPLLYYSSSLTSLQTPHKI